ncbi:hypothetical protein INT45_012669 [Circinella minor]|uniref:F-box domain-containing protein n=1 Tax=Circinella minor TaxID=1195481 RepID=A0A8H7S3F1_9FUNG|nr:hypothetical protein INT45_012669 [Circinella minor]
MPILQSPIGILSKLPIEVIDCLLRMLPDRDLVCVGRINPWYRNMIVPILTERITFQIKKDGWRIYVNAVTQFVVREDQPEEQNNNLVTATNDTTFFSSSNKTKNNDILETLPENWNDQEARLLGEQCTVNKETLALEFDILPLDDEHGFRALMINDNNRTNASSSSAAVASTLAVAHRKRSILLPVNPRHTEIDIQLYFAKIGTDDNEEEENEQQEQQKQRHHFRLEQANMMSSIPLGVRNLCHQAHLNGEFENEVSFGDIQDVSVHYRVTLPSATTIQVEFDKIQASPEWFICQMTNPYDFDMQRISEHSIW